MNPARFWPFGVLAGVRATRRRFPMGRPRHSDALRELVKDSPAMESLLTKLFGEALPPQQDDDSGPTAVAWSIWDVWNRMEPSSGPRMVRRHVPWLGWRPCYDDTNLTEVFWNATLAIATLAVWPLVWVCAHSARCPRALLDYEDARQIQWTHPWGNWNLWFGKCVTCVRSCMIKDEGW